MYELKKMERYLRVNLWGPGPRLMKKVFTEPRSHKFEKNCSNPCRQLSDNDTNLDRIACTHKRTLYKFQ